MAREKEGETNYMKLIIPREKWERGKPSALYNPDNGKSCCVGLYLQACGLSTETLSLKRTANSVLLRDKIPGDAKWLVGPYCESAPSDVAADLYEANDRRFISEKERESLIAERFMSGGDVEVEFI
jgi:hypothetical protein